MDLLHAKCLTDALFREVCVLALTESWLDESSRIQRLSWMALRYFGQTNRVGVLTSKYTRGFVILTWSCSPCPPVPFISRRSSRQLCLVVCMSLQVPTLKGSSDAHFAQVDMIL